MSQKDRQSHQLSVYRNIRADCWENESDEVKAEIQKLFDEEHGVKDDDENAEESEAKEDVDNDGDFNNDDDDEEKTLLRQQQE